MSVQFPQLMEVLRAPIVTEKAVATSQNQDRYVFRVLKTATKRVIQEAIERAFQVQVKRVTTLNLKGKTKKRGQNLGKRKDWKKAYVVLKEGHTIDLASV